jgi:hypothetical protein
VIVIVNQLQTLLAILGATLIKIDISKTFRIWIGILPFTTFPVVKGSPVLEDPFPNITFKTFNEFIKQQFSSNISLSTVLVILFSLTENPDLLNLHARQQYVKCKGEHRTTSSGWIKSLARALKANIHKNQNKPLKMKNVDKDAEEEHIIAAFGLRLDGLAKLLGLHPYDNDGEFQGKLNPVSHKMIQPVHVLCPIATECKTQNCNGRSLLQNTPTRDVPEVTLIKNSVMYKNVPVLTGQCSTCQTKYLADHERAIENSAQDKHSKVYLNSAKYLKVGQNLWVDRLFSNGVVNGMYSFHASAAAYKEYWNDSFWKQQSNQVKPISRRQVWQAFTQETIRSIAAASNYDLILSDNLNIDEVTKEAFFILGNNGLITAANNHSCSECTHEYKRTADTLPGENGAHQANIQIPSTSDDDMEVDKAMITMAVLDGIVMGPTVC